MTSSLVVAFALLQATASVSPAPTAAVVQPVSAAAVQPVAAAALAVTPDAAADAAPADPTVCRRIEQSGSPFSVKQCHRMSVWNRMARGEN